jgi:hypothetical protein
MHYHPVLKYRNVRRVTDDLFCIVIECDDPRFNAVETRALLERIGGRNVEELEA